ncbi:Heat shock transcription factor [Coniothyrium glycines]
MSTRKRRAPGASPQVPTQTYKQDIPAPSDPYMNWNDPALGANMSGFNDNSLFDNYGANMGGGHNRVVSLDGLNDGTEINSGQLIRRNTNQQLAPAPRRNQWEGFPSEVQQWEEMDDDADLEQKAQAAKKDAQAKRKQIPPFVQKLSSFLDNNKNQNLIRWSDDGNSFIVLDEDEFARTLIPELFKHNNYASFVRQLNMYGFHKKVGLSDNSMKASETKAKAPSEYYNKYFKRNRPELLWLIQKPKNPTTGPKRKREEDGKGDSDDERKYVQDTGGGGYVEELAVRANEQMAMIPRTEYNSLRHEVRELQQQQKLISNVLSQIKRQNEELYSRATSFQQLHDRHENSINAILTFLATFYNRSLEGNTNGLNLADMFPAARQQPHGNVVDVDDFPTQDLQKSPHLQRNKRPLAILPAPPTTQPDLLAPTTTGRATTMSPTTRPIPSPITRPGSRSSPFRTSNSQQQSAFPAPQGRDSSAAKPVKIESPSGLTTLPENDEIMSAIQNANANAGQHTSQTPSFDYAAALSNYPTQDGNIPLTTQQRNEVLNTIANNTATQNNNNALTNPTPPDMNALLNDLVQYQATQQQLEMLQKLSDQQNSRIQNIQERVLPLSPSGQIPGITDDNYFGGAGLGEPGQYDLDFDNLVQDQDFYPNGAAGVQGTSNANVSPGLPDFNFDTSTPFDGPSTDAFNFSADGNADDGHLVVGDESINEHGRIESVGSSNATSPAATVEEVEDESRKRSPKRRRK